MPCKPRKPRISPTPETLAKLSAANPPDSIQRLNLKDTSADDNPGQTQQISVLLRLDQIDSLAKIPKSRSLLIRKAVDLLLESLNNTNPPQTHQQ